MSVQECAAVQMAIDTQPAHSLLEHYHIFLYEFFSMALIIHQWVSCLDVILILHKTRPLQNYGRNPDWKQSR